MVGILDRDLRGGNVESHDRDGSSEECGPAGQLNCHSAVVSAGPFCQLGVSLKHLLLLGSVSGILYAFNFHNGNELLLICIY